MKSIDEFMKYLNTVAFMDILPNNASFSLPFVVPVEKTFYYAIMGIYRSGNVTGCYLYDPNDFQKCYQLRAESINAKAKNIPVDKPPSSSDLSIIESYKTLISDSQTIIQAIMSHQIIPKKTAKEFWEIFCTAYSELAKNTYFLYGYDYFAAIYNATQG